MKFFFIVLTLMSVNSFASHTCTIDVENEISADPKVRDLFQYILMNKNILTRKGYRLITATGPIPSFVVYISREKIGGREYLDIMFHDMIHEESMSNSVLNRNDQSSVYKLLSHLPNCR